MTFFVSFWCVTSQQAIKYVWKWLVKKASFVSFFHWLGMAWFTFSLINSQRLNLSNFSLKNRLIQLATKTANTFNRSNKLTVDIHIPNTLERINGIMIPHRWFDCICRFDIKAGKDWQSSGLGWKDSLSGKVRMNRWLQMIYHRLKSLLYIFSKKRKGRKWKKPNAVDWWSSSCGYM